LHRFGWPPTGRPAFSIHQNNTRQVFENLTGFFDNNFTTWIKYKHKSAHLAFGQILYNGLMSLQRWGKPFPWMVVFIFAIGYVLFSLSAHQWDPFSFVLIGGRYDPAANNTYPGYDGQFAYQIALDPANAWKFMDIPAYRYQRILYPLVARYLSLGNTAVLPWMLILINLVSIVAGTWIIERLLVAHGQSRWYALSYGLFGGMLVSLRLDLTEPLAFLFSLAGLWQFEHRHWYSSAALFVLAAFTREVTLVFAAACCLSLLANHKIRAGLIWGAAVGVPFLIWQGLLYNTFKMVGIKAGGAMSDPVELIPFHGWWGYASVNPTDFWVKSLLIVPMVLLPVLAMLWIAVRSIRRGSHTIAEWGLLLNGLLVAILPRSIILDPLGILRTMIGPVLGVIYFGLSKPSRRALNYSLLWLILLIFIILDSFIPVFV
jgi:hypothetical protein